MNKFKRLFAGALVLIIICCNSIQSQAADTTWQSDYVYDTINDDGVMKIILKDYEGEDYMIFVPSIAVISGEEYTVVIGRNADGRSVWYNKRAVVENIELDSGVELPVDCSHLFSDMDNLIGLFFSSETDTSHVINMSYMMSGCYNLRYLGLSDINMINVVNVEGMFLDLDGMYYIETPYNITKPIALPTLMYDDYTYYEDIPILNESIILTDEEPEGYDTPMFGTYTVKFVDIVHMDYNVVDKEMKCRVDFEVTGKLRKNFTLCITTTEDIGQYNMIEELNAYNEYGSTLAFEGQYSAPVSYRPIGEHIILWWDGDTLFSGMALEKDDINEVTPTIVSMEMSIDRKFLEKDMYICCTRGWYIFAMDTESIREAYVN